MNGQVSTNEPTSHGVGLAKQSETRLEPTWSHHLRGKADLFSGLSSMYPLHPVFLLEPQGLSDIATKFPGNKSLSGRGTLVLHSMPTCRCRQSLARVEL